MKESIQSIDKRCVFRETFESEQSVRRNGGVPTAGVTFSNGKANLSLVTDYIQAYRKSSERAYFTIRAIFNNTSSVANKYVFNTLVYGGTEYIYFDGTRGYKGVGTMYINGIAGVFTGAGKVEVVVAGTILDRSDFRIGGYGGEGIVSDIELFEIYSGTLTAEEVKNLYENKRHKELNVNHGKQLGEELCLNGGFDSDTVWTCGAGWVINGGLMNVNAVATTSVNQSILTIGKTYRIIFTITSYVSGNIIPYCGNAGQGTSRISGGTFTEDILCAGNTIMYLYTSTGFVGSIDNVSVKEILVNSTKEILNVSAFDGTIRNKYSGETYTELCVNGGFDADTDWTKIGSSVLIANGVATNNGTNVSTSYLQTSSNPFVLGKVYNISFNASNITGSVSHCIGAGLNFNIVNGKNSNIGICTGNVEFFFTFAVGSTAIIDNVSIKEVIPSVIPTAVEVVKDGDVYAIKFNSSGNIVCGSYDDLTGDITFNFWFNNYKNARDFVLKSSYLLYSSTGSGRVSWEDVGINLFLFRDGISYAYANNPLYNYYKKLILLTIVSDASGITTFYINGVAIAMSDNTTGTPIPWGDIIIGYNGTYYPQGLMYSVRIIKGLLTPQEISQIYSSEKSKFGL